VTSGRKIRANRANAQASTGPKSAQGRARVARNAFRHALSLPVCSDPRLSEEVQALAREIAGPDSDAEIQELALRIAEAQVDLHRVRYARHRLLFEALSDPDYESEATQWRKLRLMVRCTGVSGPTTPMPADVMEFLNSKPEGSWKFATILSDKARQLLALDRYERRALSRRKFAVREFDRARARPSRYTSPCM